MSNVKKAKDHCGYEAKPVLRTCGNCAAFASDFVTPAWVKTDRDRAYVEDGTYAKQEKNMRCTDHGFATKKLATCRLYRAKPVAPVVAPAQASK